MSISWTSITLNDLMLKNYTTIQDMNLRNKEDMKRKRVTFITNKYLIREFTSNSRESKETMNQMMTFCEDTLTNSKSWDKLLRATNIFTHIKTFSSRKMMSLLKLYCIQNLSKKSTINQTIQNSQIKKIMSTTQWMTMRNKRKVLELKSLILTTAAP